MVDKRSYMLFDAHQEMFDAYVYQFIVHEEDVLYSNRHIFDEFYKPVLDAQGVKFVNMAIGGDHIAQILYSASEDRFWDAHKKLDILLSDLESGCESFIICRDNADIERVLSTDAIGIFAKISGGRPLQGKKNLNILANLRSLYRSGLRSVQITGNGRNRLGDGVAQERSRGKLTNFGVEVVKEADRLGMLIDCSQLSDHGFYDLAGLTDSPIIDSHTGSKSLCDHPRNISDERMKNIASSGGVVGLSFLAALLAGNKETPDLDDLIRHIDHVVETVGIDHVALGPDYCAYQTPMNREVVKGYANRGPYFCDFDRLTPMQSEKYPGIVEGVDYGIRKSDYIIGPDHHELFGQVIPALEAHGYTPEDIAKIGGSNMLRVYREVLQ